MTVNPRQSFRMKLCLWIFTVAIFVFALILTATFYFTVNDAKKNIRNTVESKLAYIARSIDEGVTWTEVAAENFLTIIQAPFVLNTPENIDSSCIYFLKANPRTSSVVAAFEPGVIVGKPEGFAASLSNTEGSTIKDLAQIYDYRSNSWYKDTFESGEARWSEPFRKSDGDLVAAYSVPFFDSKGNKDGVMAFGLSLQVVADSLQSLKPYPNAKMYIVLQDGRYVIHPDQDSILVARMDSSLLAKVTDESTDWCTYDKKKHCLFYTKEPETGWIICMDVPTTDMTRNLAGLTRGLAIDVILGILLLLLVSYYTITKLTKPLESFAAAAQKISHGQFHVSLPVIKDHNELYDLRQALASMEVSLNQYIAQLEETSSKKATIEEELNIARSIQMSMVPKIFPPYPERNDVDIFASLTPALAVGGDLYDFALVDDTLIFCIGDVSGKGVPASLFMAITRALFRNLACAGKGPAEIAKALNDTISDNNPESMFVTMFIGACNLKDGTFTCCNCGHNAPLTNGKIADPSTNVVTASDKPHYMTAVPTNIPVGAYKGFDYKEVTMHLDPGNIILLYTDGVTEAENTSHHLFGEDRLLQVAECLSIETSSEQIVSTIFNSVKVFTKEAQQSDDITMLCIKYKG